MPAKSNKKYGFITTTEIARELFDYADGKLYWKFTVNSKAVKGSEAGTVNAQGYRIITLNGKKTRVHRIVWLWHGRDLPLQIDHINGNRLDNHIENLREADYSTNGFNSKLKSNNTSGVKGVSWCNTYNKWIVQIYAFKKKISARFHNFEDAVSFVKAKRAELHGEFANDGKHQFENDLEMNKLNNEGDV